MSVVVTHVQHGHARLVLRYMYVQVHVIFMRVQSGRHMRTDVY